MNIALFKKMLEDMIKDESKLKDEFYQGRVSALKFILDVIVDKEEMNKTHNSRKD